MILGDGRRRKRKKGETGTENVQGRQILRGVSLKTSAFSARNVLCIDSTSQCHEQISSEFIFKGTFKPRKDWGMVDPVNLSTRSPWYRLNHGEVPLTQSAPSTVQFSSDPWYRWTSVSSNQFSKGLFRRKRWERFLFVFNMPVSTLDLSAQLLFPRAGDWGTPNQRGCTTTLVGAKPF